MDYDEIIDLLRKTISILEKKLHWQNINVNLKNKRVNIDITNLNYMNELLSDNDEEVIIKNHIHRFIQTTLFSYYPEALFYEITVFYRFDKNIYPVILKN